MRQSLMLLVLVLACAEGTAPGTVFQLEQASLDIVSGADQADTVGRELTTPVRIRVTAPVEGRGDSTAPVPGQIVNFVVTAGGGTVFAGAAITNDSGIAREIWTLGPTAGEQRLEARAVDPETGDPIVFATVTATGIPAAVDVATLRDTFGWVGADVAVAARVTDRYGNAISWTLEGSAAAPAADRARATEAGIHQLRLVARGDTVTAASYRAWTDPRGANLTLTTRCRGGLSDYDSAHVTMTRAADWLVEPGSHSFVWVDGNRRAMISTMTRTIVRWHSGGTVDTLSRVHPRDEHPGGSEQLIQALAPWPAPDSLRFGQSAAVFAVRVAANRWGAAAPHRVCDEWPAADSLIVVGSG